MDLPTKTQREAGILYMIHRALNCPGSVSRYILLNHETDLVEIVSKDGAMFSDPYDDEKKYTWIATVYPDSFKKIQTEVKTS